MHKTLRGPLSALLLLCAAAPALAQQPAAAAADSVLARASDSRVKGAESAPVTLVELSDFQCPFCGEFARNTMAALDSAYVRTGKVRVVYFNFPLPNHPQAWIAAEAALCAGAQGRFWPMHDRLFAEQEAWSGSERAAELFEQYAGSLGVDLQAFRACTRDDLVAPILVADLLQAAQSGASSTPTFFLSASGGQPKALSGALPFATIQAEIETLLKN